MKQIDLHTHTRASDGCKTPRDLVAYALENGVAVLAITDHDTVAGIPEALAAAEDESIRVVPGIEFSIDFGPGTFHLLAYNIDCSDADLLARTRDLVMKRETRAARMVEDLRRHGYDITLEEVAAEAAGGVTGKPHAARVLVRKGYAARDTVFREFFEKGKPGHAPKEKIALDEAFGLIKKSGGFAVLAHPISLELERSAYAAFIDDLKRKGLAGVEAYADMHSPEDVALFAGISRDLGLLMTGGSDYHGDKNERIGHYAGNVIPFELYDAFKERL